MSTIIGNSLTENLTTLISKITQMESDNKKLNEDIRAIEKEKEEGYKTFNTDTHILLKRDDLYELMSDIESLESTADTAHDEASSARSYVEEAQYSAGTVRDEANRCFRDLETMLQKAEEESMLEEEKAFKAPAKKTAMKGGA
jgi:outer membrane murein-binding lipoprotein Lpp